ncbi:MAG: hypothetical protein ACI35T_01425 [Alistipes sp.]
MKQRLFFAVAIFIAAFAWQDSVCAANRKYGSDLTDSVRINIDCSRRMLDSGDLNGACNSWLAADRLLYRLGGSDRLKKNKKNIELVSALCKDVNSLSDTILGILFRNRDYAMLQAVDKTRKATRWRDYPYSDKNGCIAPAYTKTYGRSVTDKQVIAGDTTGIDVQQYMYYLSKTRRLHLDYDCKKQEAIGAESVLPLMDKDACDAAALYWKWYGKCCVAPYASETIYFQKQYEAKYGTKYGWDLTKIYGPMYSDYARRLITTFWFDKLRIYDERYKAWEDCYMFDKLCVLDRELAARYAKMYGYTKLYAKAIASERPEEAFEISGNSEYLKQHQQNLSKWNMSEMEYQRRRAACGSWDEFYSQIKDHERDVANLYRVQQENRRREERNAQIRERERKAEIQQRDKSVLDDYKPRVAKALSSGDYLGAERLAKEALGKMGGGDAYLYYVCAEAYYRKTLDFDLGTHENAHEYFRAYRNEAQHLVEMCNRSLNLDSTSSNGAYFVRGIAYTVLGSTDLAISDFKLLSARSDETGAVACYNIGIAAKNAKRWSAAIEAFKQARERSSSDSIRSKSLTHIKTCQEKMK